MTQANAALVQGKTVALFRDVSNTDSHGRLLRYVFIGGTFGQCSFSCRDGRG